MNRGDSTTEGMAILAILIIIIVIMPKGNFSSPANSSKGSTSNTSGENVGVPNSSYAGKVSIGTGNASYAYQSYEEYITIYNRGIDPLDITNWQLVNGKDERAYNLGGGNLQHFPSDTATIPKAALFISPSGNNILENTILQSGENAIITTGKIGSQSPYKIVSFKENICSGYLEDLSEYEFTPSLDRNCPRPREEPGVKNLDTDCRKFVERMSSCHTPEFETRDRNGNICYNCVDGTPLSSSCVAFIKNHFNYGSCVANHVSDKDFSKNTWRIFLNKGWEMWAKDYETIELFDQFGRLVDSHSY